jgi:hypothetical protein
MAVCAAPFAVALVWRLVTLPQRRARLAGQWQALLAVVRANPDARICRVVQVHQRARTGSKAFVVWLDRAAGSGEQQDAWFPDVQVQPGTILVVRGRVRYGPHRNDPRIFDAGSRTGILAVVPAAAQRAWRDSQSAARSSRR